MVNRLEYRGWFRRKGLRAAVCTGTGGSRVSSRNRKGLADHVHVFGHHLGTTEVV